MNDSVMYGVIYISLGLLAFYVISFSVTFVVKARQAAILRRAVIIVPVFEHAVQPSSQQTWNPGRNRILSYDPTGMAFLVRARHPFEIIGGVGYYFPFEVERLTSDLFLVWDSVKPDPHATNWQGLKGKYAFIPCPKTEADGGEFPFVQEVQ